LLRRGLAVLLAGGVGASAALSVWLVFAPTSAARPSASQASASQSAAYGSLDTPSIVAGTFPAGTGSPSPFDDGDSGVRSPLRRYVGQSIVLLTDTRDEYATALLAKLDSFIAQANANMARILETEGSLRQTQIIVFETQERYQEHARQNAPGLVNNGGYYDGGMRTVVTYRFNNSMQLYFHELVHAMMGEQFGDHHFSRYTRRNWPIWFDEGMSEYLGSFEVRGQGIVIPAANKGKLAYLTNAIAHDAYVDLASLLRAPADKFSGASMNIYYAEAWGLFDYLLSTPALRGRMAVFFRKIRSGDDGIAAFRASFGDDLAALDTAWRAHVQRAAQPATGWVQLFSGESIDDWTIHEGGQWRAGHGEISGAGDRNYNYLIKSELPLTDFSYEVDLLLQRGTAGLILGNNYHGEYPYHYLIDVARDAVMLRRAHSSSQIEPVLQAYAEMPLGEWVRLRVQVIDQTLRLFVNGREALSSRVDRDRFSLFGMYLYRARVKFRHIQVRAEPASDAMSNRVAAPTVPANLTPTLPAATPVGGSGGATTPNPSQVQ
jgi:hypothetical protein